MVIELDNFKKDNNLNHKEEMYLFYSKWLLFLYFFSFNKNIFVAGFFK